MLAGLIFGFLFSAHVLWAFTRSKKLTRALISATVGNNDPRWFYAADFMKAADGAVSSALIIVVLREMVNEGTLETGDDRSPWNGSSVLYRRRKVIEKTGTVC